MQDFNNSTALWQYVSNFVALLINRSPILIDSCNYTFGFIANFIIYYLNPCDDHTFLLLKLMLEWTYRQTEENKLFATQHIFDILLTIIFKDSSNENDNSNENNNNSIYNENNNYDISFNNNIDYKYNCIHNYSEFGGINQNSEKFEFFIELTEKWYALKCLGNIVFDSPEMAYLFVVNNPMKNFIDFFSNPEFARYKPCVEELMNCVYAKLINDNIMFQSTFFDEFFDALLLRLQNFSETEFVVADFDFLANYIEQCDSNMNIFVEKFRFADIFDMIKYFTSSLQVQIILDLVFLALGKKIEHNEINDDKSPLSEISLNGLFYLFYSNFKETIRYSTEYKISFCRFVSNFFDAFPSKIQEYFYSNKIDAPKRRSQNEDDVKKRNIFKIFFNFLKEERYEVKTHVLILLVKVSHMHCLKNYFNEDLVQLILSLFESEQTDVVRNALLLLYEMVNDPTTEREGEQGCTSTERERDERKRYNLFLRGDFAAVDGFEAIESLLMTDFINEECASICNSMLEFKKQTENIYGYSLYYICSDDDTFLNEEEENSEQYGPIEPFQNVFY